MADNKNAKSRLKSISTYLTGTDTSFLDSLRLKRRADQAHHLSTMDPLRFLLRSGMLYANKPAIIHQNVTYTYRRLIERVLCLANALLDEYNIKTGDRVGILCQNIPSFVESIYAIPASGAIMVPFNTRLAAAEIEYIIGHSGCSVLIVQQFFLDSRQASINQLSKLYPFLKIIVVADLPNSPHLDPYEILLTRHVDKRVWKDLPLVDDENAVLSINYTSGSTGKPKGVMITYRGAYLHALNMIIHVALSNSSVMLWTLPMFHCNGWGLIWAMMAMGGTHLMLNKIDYHEIWIALKEKGVTHYNGAPTVQSEVCNHPQAERLPETVRVLSGGAVLSNVLIKKMLSLNLQPTQVYGLTETYGPIILSVEQWHLHDRHPNDINAQCKLMARQGYNTLVTDEIRVLDRTTMLDVPSNGTDIGEVCFSGNLTMKGYYDNPEETAKAIRGGYFWSGDLAVRHPDGTVELVDRRKDVIVSGGENISSLEVENVIVQLDQIFECAVVGGPDDKWGERPYAYVVPKQSNHTLQPEQVIDHCRKNLAGYKCPSKVFLVESLPKTSTGKVQKFIIRNELWEGKGRKIQ
ncbi:hypothetical protein BC941DRAFT_129020 [Chlamydoabsidia padenii]|nr:hypothetical protein BC941DRAFT_129020 [Chlamydoabsidia padenii]